jgi:hypothetical protein
MHKIIQTTLHCNNVNGISLSAFRLRIGNAELVSDGHGRLILLGGCSASQASNGQTIRNRRYQAIDNS